MPSRDRYSDMHSVEAQSTDAASTLHLYRQVLAARRSSPALRVGELTRRDAADGVLVFERRRDDDRRTVIVNFADRAADVALEGSHVIVVSTDRTPGGTTYDGVVPAESAVVVRPMSAGRD